MALDEKDAGSFKGNEKSSRESEWHCLTSEWTTAHIFFLETLETTIEHFEA